MNEQRNATGRLHRADWGAAVALLAFCGMALLSHTKPSIRLGSFFALIGLAWMGVLASWWCAGGLADKPLLRRIWIWAALFRLVGFLGNPILEDDYFRYLWDGRVFATTGNPYASKPADFFQEENLPERFRQILDNVNHPDTPTIYGPLCEVMFLLGYWIAPGQLWPIKLLLLLADLVTLRLLLNLASPRNVFLYALCPLVIQETAFTAHPDSLGVMFLVAALVACHRKSWNGLAVCLALGTGAKVFTLMFTPFLLWRSPLKSWLLFGGVLVAVYGPFVFQSNAGGSAGLAAMLQGWEFNSTGYAALRLVLGPAGAKMACALLLAAFGFVYFRNWIDLASRSGASGSEVQSLSLPRGDWIFGMFFVLSPVVNPWYLLWLLPFVVSRPTAAGVTVLIVVSVAYAHGLNIGSESLGAYEHPAWVRPVEITAVLLALGWDLRRRLAHLKRNRD